MTKSQFIEHFADRQGISVAEADELVTAFFASMKDALIDGQRVEIRGFGVFSIRDQKPYTGRNPKTGDPVEVAAKKSIHFKPSKALKAAIDGQG